MSMLLTMTSNIMTKCATLTNKYKVVGSTTESKSRNVPKAIRLATNKMIKAQTLMKKTENSNLSRGHHKLGTHLLVQSRHEKRRGHADTVCGNFDRLRKLFA